MTGPRGGVGGLIFAARRNLMNRGWIRRLGTLVVGLVCLAAFTTTNVGCAVKNCGPCGHGCSKPCCKKPYDKPCDKKADEKKGEVKKEEPKKEEPKKEEAKKP
jgi:hypothetical protein